MNIIHIADVPKVPASHEDPNDPGVIKQVLLRRDDIPAGRIQMINWAALPPGKSFQPHEHRSMDEIYIMLSGTGILRVGEEEAVVQKGDTVVIPSKTMHAMTNNGSDPIEYIVIGVVTGA